MASRCSRTFFPLEGQDTLLRRHLDALLLHAGQLGGNLAAELRVLSDIMVSPSDPIFWMHHGEIDRIWSVWQANPANAGKAPALAGVDAVMDPWAETATQLQSITALGYSYA
jgi:hypothetical protein